MEATTKQKLTPAHVAEILGVSVQTVRVGLQKGYFPFGWAVQTTPRRYTYAISPKLFEEYLGTRKNEEGVIQSENCN